MRGAAQFLLELLVEDPKHHWLVTPFSMSPEHTYRDKDGNTASLSPGPTMDVALIRELFAHCIEAGKILGVDEDFRARLAATLPKLPPYRINSRGYLQEWIEDWTPGTEGHNVSPYFPFFPGDTITLRGTSGTGRLPSTNGWRRARPRGGWTGAWDTCVWARLERGDKVEQWLNALMATPTNSLADNLHNRKDQPVRRQFRPDRRRRRSALAEPRREKFPCCPPCRQAGPTARSRGCAPAAALKWILPGMMEN